MDLFALLDSLGRWVDGLDTESLVNLLLGLGFGVPIVGSFFWIRHGSKAIRGGVPGTAKVVSASGNDGRAYFQTCAMDLVVEAPGLPPTAMRYRGQVPSSRWPSPGQTLPVSVNPKRLDRVTIPWRRVPKNTSLGMAAARAVAAGMRGGSTNSATGSLLGGLLGAGLQNATLDSIQVIGDTSRLTPSQRENLRRLGIDPDRLPQGSTEASTVTALERLDSLRRSGALTEDEFQREKAHLLSGH